MLVCPVLIGLQTDGKPLLSNTIIERLNTIDCNGYTELFIGMGGILFRRKHIPNAEFINDRSCDVANLFRILQRHYPQFMETLKFQITSRKEFERLKATDRETITDLERAARFLYLQN